MQMRFVLSVALILLLASAIPACAENHLIFIRDDFDSLENWKEMYFRNIQRHTRYTIEKEGDISFLKAESDASASGIVFTKEFNVFDFPKIRWRWKISNVYQKGNARERSGDDYPLRVYIVFKYDPGTATLGKRMKYGLVKQLYGEYPPDSTLNYIWANRQQDEGIITNTYSDDAKMVLLQMGPDKAGKWIEQSVNVLEDYQKAFHEDPPAVASIAIMSDSDNTGEKAVAYIDYIEIYR